MYSLARVKQATLILSYIATLAYVMIICVFLGATVSSADNAVCLFQSTQMCCIFWWISFGIGVPSSAISIMLLYCKNLFTKHYVQMPVLCWLTLTVGYGDFVVFYSDSWCTSDKIVAIFTSGLLFQNNMIVIFLSCMFVCLEIAMCRQTRALNMMHQIPN